jgi:BirA family biotin operon repressor/biotin-[acetyl-CoA-carboxylase] ligase
MMDELTADAVSRALPVQIIGRRILHYPTLTSTMDAAREEALKGASEGTVVIADEQTAGRGRLKRTWFAPSGNLALSVILYPRITDLPSLIMLASLSVVHAIRRVTGVKAGIKWPNDILINGKKVCGILIETNVQKAHVEYAVIGVGINVNIRPADFPEITALATSLSAEAAKRVSRLAVVRALLEELDMLYRKLKSGGSLYEEWRDRLLTLGQHVTVTSGLVAQDGVAESVERDGSLLLRTAGGETTRVIAGDVTLRA